MSDSILNSTKKMVGIGEDYHAFDLDVITHINSVFATLNQLGVGPEAGFMIEDETAEWFNFLGDNPKLNSVKSYMYLRVRLLFDPPQNSFLITSQAEQIKEMEWRLNVSVDTRPSLLDEDVFIWELDSTIGQFPPEAEVGDVGIDANGILWRKT